MLNAPASGSAHTPLADHFSESVRSRSSALSRRPPRRRNGLQCSQPPSTSSSRCAGLRQPRLAHHGPRRRASLVSALQYVGSSSNERSRSSAAATTTAEQASAAPKKLSGVALRVIFGTILGLSGALIILAGGWLYAAVASLVAYQASQEYFGFVTSTGITQGMKPPPPVATTLTTLLCVGLVMWTYVSFGRSTAALAVSSFAVLSLQLLSFDSTPRFAQLTSSVFGLFYCGGCRLSSVEHH